MGDFLVEGKRQHGGAHGHIRLPIAGPPNDLVIRNLCPVPVIHQIVHHVLDLAEHGLVLLGSHDVGVLYEGIRCRKGCTKPAALHLSVSIDTVRP
ncbi:hypothetical protein D3C76_1724110 [compost metagenome]